MDIMAGLVGVVVVMIAGYLWCPEMTRSELYIIALAGAILGIIMWQERKE